MERVGPEGIILVLLRAQFGLSLAMLFLAPFWGGALLFFTQLPGGMMDAGTSTTGQDSALYAGLFHVIYTGALGIFLFGLSRDLPTRPTVMAHTLATILTFPFGVMLAHRAWRVTQEDGWDVAYHDAGRVGRRMAFGLGGVWAGVQLIASLATLVAYVALLSGTLLIGLIAIVSNLVIQWAGLQAVRRWQAKTRLRTFGSPLPELPSQPSSR
ncbi:MAG: hypothetical protein ACPHID_05955 [Thermoplasmatota archaeon]